MNYENLKSKIVTNENEWVKVVNENGKSMKRI